MQIQIHTDRNIKEHEAPAAQVSSVVESALSRFSDHITRVEVHLSDETGDKKAAVLDVLPEHCPADPVTGPVS